MLLRGAVSTWMVLWAGAVVADDRLTKEMKTPAPQANPLEAMSRFVGGRWIAPFDPNDPSKGFMRVVYEWGVGRRIIHLHSHVVNGYKDQHNYDGVFFWRPREKKIVCQAFSAWGALYEGDTNVQGDRIEHAFTDYTGDKVAHWRETLRFTGEDSYEWDLFKQTDSGWEPSKKAAFRRERIAPIASAGMSDRRLEKEVIVQATPADVWRAWTTREGITEFFAPGANIELRVGGPYEIYFAPDQPPGARGADGCRVLSYVPQEMLSFDWNAPPAVPRLREAEARTHVVLRFEKADDRHVRVRLTQLGFGPGEDWEKYYQYFDRAWGHVLDGLKKHFGE